MKFGQIFECDIANGEGCRTSLFVSGCTHHCKECFNPETWDFNFGQDYTAETEELIIDSLRPEYIRGLTILGGEPMEPANQPEVRRLVERVKRELPGSDIWIYSGLPLRNWYPPAINVVIQKIRCLFCVIRIFLLTVNFIFLKKI